MLQQFIEWTHKVSIRFFIQQHLEPFYFCSLSIPYTKNVFWLSVCLIIEVNMNYQSSSPSTYQHTKAVHHALINIPKQFTIHLLTYQSSSSCTY